MNYIEGFVGDENDYEIDLEILRVTLRKIVYDNLKEVGLCDQWCETLSRVYMEVELDV